MSRVMSPWQHRAWARLGPPLAASRLGHALLLTGPVQLGKRELAMALAQRLLCVQPADAAGPACGNCRSCRLFAAGNHPDFASVTIELNEKTGKPRSEILVDQIRALGRWLNLTAQFGGCQAALIEPADGMKGAAANALLKSLEEPLPGRYLILVTARPAQLPATIRSRCQRIEMALPARSEARQWLLDRGIEDGLAERALSAADGNPGVALGYLDEQVLALREEVRADLAALAAGRARPLAVAQRWAEGATAERLRFAAEFVRDIGRAQARGRPEPALQRAGLTATGDIPKLAGWFDAANRTRELLDAPLRSDFLLVGLLQQWVSALRH
jgi:DNA polymerase-3 subunit delta'